MNNRPLCNTTRTRKQSSFSIKKGADPLFNQAQFNQLKFNQTTVAELLFSMKASGYSGFSLHGARNTTTKGQFDATGSTVWGFGKITFTEMLAAGVGGIKLPLGKIRTFKTNWQAIGTIKIENESYTIFIMEYFGDLAPNDRVIINTDKFTVTKNNNNALFEFDGNFIDLKEGINEIVFEDGETTRTILLRVEHRDRFL